MSIEFFSSAVIVLMHSKLTLDDLVETRVPSGRPTVGQRRGEGQHRECPRTAGAGASAALPAMLTSTCRSPASCRCLDSLRELY